MALAASPTAGTADVDCILGMVPLNRTHARSHCLAQRAARNRLSIAVFALDVSNILLADILRVDGNAEFFMSFVSTNVILPEDGVLMRHVVVVGQDDNRAMLRLQ